MNQLIQSFNNREIAILIWLFVLSIWAASRKDFRASFYSLLKHLLHWKILLILCSMFLYIWLILVALQRTGFWDVLALKDTVIWVFGVAFVMLFNLDRASKNDDFFRSAIFNNLKLIVAFEFIVNLVSFSLIAELLIVPIATILVLLKAAAEASHEYEQTATVLNYALGLIGIFLLIITLRHLVIEFQEFATFRNLRDLLLPVVLTSMFFPFIYLLALLDGYQRIFRAIESYNDDPALISYAKRKILFAFHLDLGKLNALSRKPIKLKVNGKDDVLELIRVPQDQEELQS